MKIALCQLDIVWEDKTANHRHVLELVDSFGLESGSLLVLPEMFATGFSMDVARVSEGEDQPTSCFLRELAASRGVYVLGGLARRGLDGRGINEAVAYDPRGVELARYAKIHPFLGGEAKYYSGGSNVELFEAGGFRVCPLICYDLRFPEVFRAGVIQGAELFTVIANWPVTRIEHWTTLLRARAIENQAYVVGVNRCGRDPGFEYPGSSLVVDPKGSVIASLGLEESLVSVELDPQVVSDWRREFPVLRDIRIPMSFTQPGN